LPSLVGCLLDPLIGAVGDTSYRRKLVVAGGAAFAGSIALVAGAPGFWALLVALLVANPASGAFVGLAQATLMDLLPAERERGMAGWTLRSGRHACTKRCGARGAPQSPWAGSRASPGRRSRLSSARSPRRSALVRRCGFPSSPRPRSCSAPAARS